MANRPATTFASCPAIDAVLTSSRLPAAALQSRATSLWKARHVCAGQTVTVCTVKDIERAGPKGKMVSAGSAHRPDEDLW